MSRALRGRDATLGEKHWHCLQQQQWNRTFSEGKDTFRVREEANEDEMTITRDGLLDEAPRPSFTPSPGLN
jgi:hypothetical protein